MDIVVRFRRDDPHFGDFLSNLGPFFYVSSRSDWPLLYAEKIGLSLSHLAPEILGRKLDQIVHQNELFNSF